MTDASLELQPDATPGLRLAAFDSEDLAVISAHLQDATVRVGDMAYLPQMRRFALVVSRFDWPSLARGACERCQTGIHFERVLRVRHTGFDQRADTVLNLLAISFTPGDPPSGTVTLVFAGGGAVRLDVECVEAALSDMGPRWAVDEKPCAPIFEVDDA